MTDIEEELEGEFIDIYTISTIEVINANKRKGKLVINYISC